ncbi:hypothetical protein MRX96_038682 [Rhipicephalus microplus]
MCIHSFFYTWAHVSPRSPKNKTKAHRLGVTRARRNPPEEWAHLSPVLLPLLLGGVGGGRRWIRWCRATAAVVRSPKGKTCPAAGRLAAAVAAKTFTDGGRGGARNHLRPPSSSPRRGGILAVFLVTQMVLLLRGGRIPLS